MKSIRVEFNVGRLGKTARGTVLNQVRFGMTMSRKVRKDGTWHKKAGQGRINTVPSKVRLGMTRLGESRKG